MDEYESLSHTKWECKYHGMQCSAYRDVCGVQEYAQYRADLPKVQFVEPSLHCITMRAST
jgi:hypothetical protein